MQNEQILDTVEPEIVERLVSRRDAIKKGAAVSGVVAAGLRMGSVPVALAALSKDAFGQSNPGLVTEVLQFAFLLENLEFHFYDQVLTGAAFAPVRATFTADETRVLTVIRDHERAHVDFLRAALGSAAASYTAASFDFTGGNGSNNGPFVGALTNKAVLLAGAQAFEDTGVRAYKGSAGDLMSNKAVLTAALQIHSVEARHAAKVRKMRGLKGWITGNTSGIDVPAGPNQAAGQQVISMVYEGEQNTTHAGFNVTSLASLGANGGTNAATEAFDEPLTRVQVTAIVAPFVIGNNP